jgi:ribosomal protein L11 methyltransferase
MFELRLMCPEHRVEAISEALDALDALSVSVEDADAQTDAEVALFGEPGMPAPKEGWQRSRLTALFADGLAASEAGQLLQAQDFFDGCAVLGANTVPDQDWVRLTQSQFAPVDITPTFWIVPTWHNPPEAAQTVIRLDPGLAFGTGTHPTTKMCLRWIANHPMPKTVLDYGCGSGILAIACAKFGSTDVLAVDIDPAAVDSTQANALANKVMLTSGLPYLARASYGLVVANILSSPLKVLASLLCAHVDAGGTLLLSGILERQADELARAYAPYCALTVADMQDGWVLMSAAL